MKTMEIRRAGERIPGGQAFTLLEMMVVLAVIALLGGMIFHAHLQHREKARVALCKSNLRQFVAALNNVFGDRGNTIMSGFSTVSGVPNIDQNVVIGGIPGRQDWQAAGFYHAVDPNARPPPTDYIFGFVFPYIRGRTLNYWQTYSLINAPPAGPPFLQGEDVAASPCYCPSVMGLLPAFTTNNPVTGVQNQRPPHFKGYTRDAVTMAGIDSGRYCAYAKNAAPNVSVPRSRIPGRLVAFCDWNLLVGWNAVISLSYTNMADNVYLFSSPAGANPFYTQGDNKRDLPCRSDVGFHHAGGGQFAANLAMFDGRVESVASNNITNAAFWAE